MEKDEDEGGRRSRTRGECGRKSERAESQRKNSRGDLNRMKILLLKVPKEVNKYTINYLEIGGRGRA